MIDFLVNNWWIIIVAIAVIAIAYVFVRKFAGMPTNDQIEKIKEWLLMAVTQAEKELGSGTGALKLSYVYNLFINAFPAVAKFLPFSVFSQLVDEVLEQFRKMLESNENLKNYVGTKEEK